MITGRQVQAARALLNWKQEMLGLPVHEGTRDQVRRRWSVPVCCSSIRIAVAASCCSTRHRLSQPEGPRAAALECGYA